MKLNESYLVDTHCHLYHKQLQSDIEAVCDRAFEAGVKRILLPAITLDSLKLMDKLHHSGIQFGKMAGIHPCDVTVITQSEESLLDAECNSDDIIGVGESGLDYYWSTEWVAEQQRSFRHHCRIARETGKPLVIHNRNSTEDVLRIVEEEQDGRLTGVWHCFNGSYDEGIKAIDLGLYLGIGGVVTYKNSGVAETVARLPFDRIILETDSPYLSPVPHRGKRNEPSYVRLVAEKIAEVKEMTLEEVAIMTTNNALSLFQIS